MLKELGWVEPRLCREAPWKIVRYEPFRPNQIWGEDWTILTIAGMRYYLLAIIDYFSRFIVAWGIVKSVSQREVQNLLAHFDRVRRREILDEGAAEMQRERYI